MRVHNKLLVSLIFKKIIFDFLWTEVIYKYNKMAVSEMKPCCL